MTVQSLVDTYGYLAILLGTFIEGETILVLGGFVAHRGYLHLPWVILAAFIGTLCGDQLFFFLGRRRSQAFLAKRPSWKERIDRTHRLLDRFRIPLILGFRFLYGLRTVTPFVIGMSPVPTAQFVFLNAVGAMVWAIAVGTGGYLFGNALEILIGNVKRYEFLVFGAIAFIGGSIWSLTFLGRRRRQNRSTQSPPEAS
jgi:membrane protein DedA with SNARE-associated domain